jgi:undecaprenol kinase
MNPYQKSFGYAVEGLRHALEYERNLRLFIVAYFFSILLGFLFGLQLQEWIAVVLSGGVFLTFELYNTALERFTDAFDDHSKKQEDHYYASIKATKDVAAAGSLLCGIVWVVVLLMSYLPYIIVLLARFGALQ